MSTGLGAAGRVGRVAAMAGLVWALLLFARLIQVQVAPGRAGLGFALLGGVLVVGPFAISVLAPRRVGPTGVRVAWFVCGLLAMGVGLLSPASFPLLLAGVVLVASAVLLHPGVDRTAV